MSSWREVGALLIDCDDPQFNIVVSLLTSADIITVNMLTSDVRLYMQRASDDVLDSFMSATCERVM